MALLDNRVKIKGHVHELWRLLHFFLAKSFAIILIMFALLVVASNSLVISNSTMEISGRVLEVGAIIHKFVASRIEFVSYKMSYFNNLESENTKLKIKLAGLENKYTSNQLLIKENEKLREMLAVIERLEEPYKVAKLLSISYSPFAKKAMINAGQRDGVEINDVVSSELALIGRVSAVSNSYAEVTLIEDVSSRVPIITDRNKFRGVLAYQDDGLKILYLDDEAIPEIGELVYSSGDGKIFPDGIKIGTVEKIDASGIHVKKIELLHGNDFVYITRVNHNFTNEVKKL